MQGQLFLDTRDLREQGLFAVCRDRCVRPHGLDTFLKLGFDTAVQLVDLGVEAYHLGMPAAQRL